MDYNDYFPEFSEAKFVNDATQLISENRGVFFTLVFWLVTFTVQAMYGSKQNKVIEDLSVDLEFEQLQNSNLKKERELLETRVDELKAELEEMHAEFKKMGLKLQTLQERNQVLCESLGDFLRFKRRKTNLASQHNYNLRDQTKVDYSGMDDNSSETSSDSDYVPTVSKS